MMAKEVTERARLWAGREVDDPTAMSARALEPPERTGIDFSGSRAHGAPQLRSTETYKVAEPLL